MVTGIVAFSASSRLKLAHASPANSTAPLESLPMETTSENNTRAQVNSEKTD